jgi:hypothetical protein
VRDGHGDVDEAVDLARSALRAVPRGSPDRVPCLAVLANALLARYREAGQRTDLDESIALARRACAAGAGPRFTAIVLNTLGVALTERCATGGGSADADEAMACLRTATATTAAPAGIRLLTAHKLAELALALHGLPAAADAYATAVDLLQLAAWHGIARSSREHLIEQHATLAAGCTVATKGASSAIGLLEQGRAVLWSHTLDRRINLTDLHARAPHIANRLHAVRAGLDTLDRQ